MFKYNTIQLGFTFSASISAQAPPSSLPPLAQSLFFSSDPAVILLDAVELDLHLFIFVFPL